MQRRYLQAFLEAFDPAHAGYLAGANPTSSVYAAPMLDLGHCTSTPGMRGPIRPSRRLGLG